MEKTTEIASDYGIDHGQERQEGNNITTTFQRISLSILEKGNVFAISRSPRYRGQ